MIDAQTRPLALLGHPVAHSLSPAMHNAGLAAAGLNACYLAFDVPPDDLAAAVAALGALGFIGANVTVPHKERVMALLDEVDPGARAAGAVNTIALREGRLWGFNTDGEGFLASLDEVGFDAGGRRALLFGAGGAARGVALALAGAGARRITLANRSPARARELAAAVNASRGEGVAAEIPLERESVRAVAPGVDLVVNCTSVGMHPHEDAAVWEDFAAFPAGALAVDLVYNPARTRFMELAASAGLDVLGGLGMLVHQAALSWRHWFGQPGPVDIFYERAYTVFGAGRAEAERESC